jgi:hypothetical protein
VNLTQYRRVMKEIANGADIEGTLYNNGGHCIMGNLLSKLGVPDEYMEHEGAPAEMNQYSEHWNDGKWMDMEAAIATTFGLSSNNQDAMMRINDNYREVADRRTALRAYMRRKFPAVHKKYLASKVKKAKITVDKAATALINTLAAKPKKARCTCGCGQMTHVAAREKVAV